MPIPTTILELVQRLSEVNCSFTQMLHVTGATPEELNSIIQNNIRPGTDQRATPSAMPNAFYINRLQQGKSVKEIADELGCNLAGLYRVLKKRSIAYWLYTQDKEDTDA